MCEHCTTEEKLLRGLANIDAILVKAGVLSEWKAVVAQERRVSDKMRKVWNRRADAAVRAAVRRIKASKGKVTEADQEAALKEIERAFDGIDDELEPAVETATREIFKLAIGATNKKVQGKFKGSLRYDFIPVQKAPPTDPSLAASFDAVDEEAVQALTRQHTFWIGDHYSRNLSRSVRELVREAAIEEGQSPQEVGRALERLLEQEFSYDPENPFAGRYASVPVGWSSSAEEYFETVGAHVATTGRVAGQISALNSVGATKYMIVNPNDERTCPECAYMSGHATSMPVDEAYSHVQRMVGASPNAVRDKLHPFGSVADYVAAARPRSDGAFTRNSGSRLIRAGYGLPPYHNRCRCTVDIADDSAFIER